MQWLIIIYNWYPGGLKLFIRILNPRDYFNEHLVIYNTVNEF